MGNSKANVIESLAAFSRRLHVTAAYVTALKQAGRLVLSRDGKVDVVASLARIEDTRDPAHVGTVERHARNRAARARAASAAEPQPTTTPAPEQQITYATSRAVKERFFALTAKLDYERAIGKMVESATVHDAGAEAGTVLRAVMENLPDQIAPLLAEGDAERERRIHAMLVEHMAAALTEVSAKLGALIGRITQT